MKKLMLSLALVAGLGTASMAQTSPVRFGIKAGLALPKMNVSAMGNSVSLDEKTSFYAGATAEFQLSELFSVQPGISYIGKGTKLGSLDLDFDEETSTTQSLTINSSYIEVPVNFLLNLRAGNAGKVFFGAGPYYAMAINANLKLGNEKEDFTIGSGEEEFRRSDFGFNFLAGFELTNGLNIHTGYGLGLGTVLGSDNEGQFKNRVFSVGLGFAF